MKRSHQLSNQELLWCRKVARKIKNTYEKYRLACYILNGSRSVIAPGSAPPAENMREWAHVMKATWEEFLGRLTEKQKELVEELSEYTRAFFTKGEKYVLRDVHRLGRKMGLW